MAEFGTRVSELPAAVDGLNGDTYMVVQNGTSKKQTRAQLKQSLGVSLTDLGAAASGVNGDITQLTNLSTDLSIAQGGTGASDAASARSNLGVRNVSTRYIDGLEVVWGANSVIVQPGSCFIQASNFLFELTAAATINLTGLTANTEYHIYAYAGAGNAPSVELSSAAPVASALGGYTKTGDTSRRYLRTLLAASATTAYRFVQDGSRVYYNAPGITAAPFAILPTGAAVMPGANVAPGVVVPLTAVAITLQATNNDPSVVARISNDDIGSITTNNFRQVLRPATAVEIDALISFTRTISYAFDTTPTSVLTLRVSGYTFKR